MSRTHWYSPVDVASKRSDAHLKRKLKLKTSLWLFLLKNAAVGTDTERQGRERREERGRRNKTKEINLMSIVPTT